jgi:hypothetical protein
MFREINVFVFELRANASQLTAVMDRSAVEVFAAQGSW